MKKCPSSLLVLACSLSFANFSSLASDNFDCPSNLPLGTYTGKLQKLLNSDTHLRTRYLFKQENTSKTACVQSAESTTPFRAKQLYNAFVLGQKVTITIGWDNYIAALAINN